MSAPTAFAAAQASGETWEAAVEDCLAQLGRPPAGANLGLVYVNEGFAYDLAEIVEALRARTGMPAWLGAVGFAVFGPAGELGDDRALSVLVGRVNDDAVMPFGGAECLDPERFLALHRPWLRSQLAVTALVHGDPRQPRLTEMIGGLSTASSAFLIGGLVAGGDSGIVGPGQETGLSGLMLGPSLPLITGLTQGCSPIGPAHQVTEVEDDVLMTLDGRPALEVLKEEAGDLIARDLRRAAGIIHIGLPRENSDGNDYSVRNLVGIDAAHGWLAVAAELAPGDRMIFVRRDPAAAQRDMQRMVDGLQRRLEGRQVTGGLYISCVARGASMFGEAGRELEIIRDGLGDFPLVGFTANGEICGDRLYAYTGVLTLFLDR